MRMWILREIEARGGEVGFREFMELALYHPEHGYYTAAAGPWGRDGDYLTAPTASQWYPATLAHFFGELATVSGSRFPLVDLAAGDGSFCASIVDHLGDSAPTVVTRISAVDRSPAMRHRAADRLAGAAVESEIGERLTNGCGRPAVVHACELYDAMPVHLVRQTGAGLEELAVAVAGEALEWRRRPAGDETIGYFEHHGVELVEGQLAEVNPVAEEAHRRVLEIIGEGLVLVLDYGYEAGRLYDPRGRLHGSLVSYRRHEVGRNLLDRPGRQDLTAHVNWDDLRRAAATSGWDEIGLMPLAEFLVRAGIGEVAESRGVGAGAELDSDTVAARQEIKRLLDPEGMGSDLKMLVQGRGELAGAAREILGRDL